MKSGGASPESSNNISTSTCGVYLKSGKHKVVPVPCQSIKMEGEHAIGIDLGTTNCCVAVYRQGGVQIIPSSVGGNVTPSHISISDTNDITIGEVSKRDHKGDLGSHFYLMKRLIGRRFEDKDVQHDRKFWTFDTVNEGGWPKVLVNGRLHKPEEISALILKTLKEEAEEYVGGLVTKAVITVPAYFSSSQRQATKNAGRLAGLDVLRIINEPTAAALGYSYRFPLETPLDRNLLVFDLGGGTLDIVVIKLGMEGIMSVLAVGGDTHLGGEDIDNRMVSHCAREFERIHGIDPLQLVNDSEKAKYDVNLRLQRLKYECEVQKSFLAAANQAIINVDYFCEGKDLKVKIMRKQFNEMNAPMFEKCIEILDNVLRSTNIEKSAIDNIIVAGGSTKIPELRRRISEYFDGRKLNYEIHGDEAVAYGAALQAAFMTGTLNLPIEIHDVVPLPIGIDSFNRSTGQIEFFELIAKNTPLPCSKSARFSARHEGQDTILTNILEGTSRVPTENHLIATFNCSHLPYALTRRSELRIELSVNAEGILEISISLDGQLLPDKLVIRDFLHPVAASDSTHLELFNINSSNVQVL